MCLDTGTYLVELWVQMTFYFNIRVQILQVKVLVRCNLHLSYLCHFLKDKEKEKKNAGYYFKIFFHFSDILKYVNYRSDDFTNLIIVP